MTFHNDSRRASKGILSRISPGSNFSAGSLLADPLQEGSLLCATPPQFPRQIRSTIYQCHSAVSSLSNQCTGGELLCLDAAGKNHSTRNSRLWLKRSWNCLNYSRNMRLSGTPSNTPTYSNCAASQDEDCDEKRSATRVM